MPIAAAFYAVNATTQPEALRVHHSNSACESGQGVPQDQRAAGTGGYPVCQHCLQLNQQSK